MQTKFIQFTTSDKMIYGGKASETNVVLVGSIKVDYAKQLISVDTLVCDSQATADKMAAKPYPFSQNMAGDSHYIVKTDTFANHPQGNDNSQGVNNTDALEIAKKGFKKTA